MKCVLYRKRKCHDIGGSELLSLHLALVVASAKLNENYHRIQRLRHVGFAAVFTFDDVIPPAVRCSICSLYFWWFRRDSLGGRYHQKYKDVK